MLVLADRYRRRTLAVMQELLRTRAPGPIRTSLDYGSGDGWFARRMLDDGTVTDVVAADIMRREDHYVEPVLYDGRRLPFADRRFELVYAVDVVHHTPEPAAALQDALRCADRWFLVKDHTYGSARGRAVLSIFDELGNRRFGVPSLYAYQRGWEWDGPCRAAGFEPVVVVHPAPVHGGWLGRATNHLQYVGLWRRVA